MQSEITLESVYEVVVSLEYQVSSLQGQLAERIEKAPWAFAEEACEIMNISNVTLTRWRSRGYGPTSYKKAGRCVYNRDEIHEFMVTPDEDGDADAPSNDKEWYQ
tara:strand:- start:3035 stop:3349 length:315 start_codon:yes stop_codon:yes gene_type:complete